ncbi:Ig-like domain-containing protein [Yinghuangia soli]|uniref:Ig-like domain-containing protein n=1 Tax=Yinghuangia soli TaxID=2908204 RepID=A0AA41PY58_9ACTN|nr:SdrD B-like domain-containing protein [Yinghuangia soli]MCF2527767.1 Ig-like domain-containing protein [Yinghuangia soli]
MPIDTPGSFWRRRVPAAALTAVVAVPFAAAAAGAAVYADWTVPAPDGTMTLPAAGLPPATVTSDSSAPLVASGSSAYLNASTPFGSVFGSSRGRPYLALKTATGNAPSTTTITFATAPAAGTWGFALGDIDADHVYISATGPDGVALTNAELGFQGTFNYCQGSPKPSSCGSTGPFDDVPTWDEANADLIGNVIDTSGASGWLRPTKPVKSLTLKFVVQSGIPLYQLWVAALTQSVGGTVTGDSPCGLPNQTVLRLLKPDGTPVVGPDGAPMTTTAAADGSYAFDPLARGNYRVAVDVPRGYTATDTAKPADATAGDALATDFRLGCRPTVISGRPTPPQPEPGRPILITLPPEIVPERPVVIVQRPEHGTVVQRPGGLEYVPEPGYTGKDTFTYTGRDAEGKTVMETVTLSVAAAPKPKPTPTAKPAPPKPQPRPAPPVLADTGSRYAAELAMAGLGSVLVGGALVVFAAKRRSED